MNDEDRKKIDDLIMQLDLLSISLENTAKTTRVATMIFMQSFLKSSPEEALRIWDEMEERFVESERNKG